MTTGTGSYRYPDAACLKIVHIDDRSQTFYCARPIGHPDHCSFSPDQLLRSKGRFQFTAATDDRVRPEHRDAYRGPLGMVDPRYHKITVASLSRLIVESEEKVRRLKGENAALRREVAWLMREAARRLLRDRPVESGEEEYDRGAAAFGGVDDDHQPADLGGVNLGLAAGEPHCGHEVDVSTYRDLAQGSRRVLRCELPKGHAGAHSRTREWYVPLRVGTVETADRIDKLVAELTEKLLETIGDAKGNEPEQGAKAPEEDR